MASISTCLFLAVWILGIGSGVVNAMAEGLGPGLQGILNQAYKAPLYTYPTSLTQGIIPKGIHSHNDYWRPVPFYSALSVGAISTEADVWLYNSTLFVGHEQSALTTSRTFESLYINPILDVLTRQNPPNPQFVTSKTKNGVFDTDAGQTLYLFVDLKTEGKATWEVVKKALQPLREKGYLTSTNGTYLFPGPVTVIGTGNTPLSLVQPIQSRDYFWDGPLPTLNSTFSNITSLVSPIASTSFTSTIGPVLGTELSSVQLEKLRSQVKTAHGKGIKVRYWDQPGWPIGTRDAIWRTLRTEGADLINVDDLDGASSL